MDKLREIFLRKLSVLSIKVVRSAIDEVPWSAQLVGVKGSRGIGKTTLILQYIKLNLSDRLEETLYVSLDNWFFSTSRLYDFVDDFFKQGGRFLFLDEVHKYENWAQELKNCYDDFPEVKIVFTGSSLIEILNARSDLSRRAMVYDLQGLSFREFLQLKGYANIPKVNFNQILDNHLDISRDVLKSIQPLSLFKEYLIHGYYPYFLEGEELFHHKLKETLTLMLEIELPLMRSVDVAYIRKIRQLLIIIADSVPFIPNVSKLSERIQIQRITLLSYLHYLDEVGVTINIFKNSQGISSLQKPQKIYLKDTNMMYALSQKDPDIGALRETFFANQVGFKNQLDHTKTGDFLVNQNLHFEIGGKGKTSSQLKGNKGFIAADNIEYGSGNVIPLWMFGLMY